MNDLSSDLAALKINRDDPGSGGSSGTSALKVLFGLVVVGVLGAVGYLLVWPALAAEVFKAEVDLTEVIVVSPAQASVNLTASGYVAAERTSRIAPKVSGTVLAVHVEQSQKVKAGQPLLEMDPTDEQAAVAAAKSRAAAARARAASAKAQIDTADAQMAEVRTQAERERRLAAQGLAPAGNAEDLEARVASLEQSKEATRAAYRAALAEAQALDAEVRLLETQLGNLRLLAPIDGTVMTKPPQIGEFIGPQPAGVSVDMGGIEITDFSSLVIEVDVPEQRLHLVEVGGPCEAVLDAFPKQRLRCRVKEVTPKVDRAKATVTVKVVFLDSFDRAIPEMSARVSFLSGELDAEAVKQPPKTIVPAEAVVERAGASVVFVLEGEQVRMVPVKLGEPFGGGFELLEGPRPTTRVIRNPSAELQDGRRVKEREVE